MNKQLLSYLKKKPKPYQASTERFWDDEHISKGMLKAHLDIHCEAATRKFDFVEKSADWIAEMTKKYNQPKLLDLGCGPGIYTELFAQKGIEVTGVDLSRRSIEHAIDSAKAKNLSICYNCLNYLELDYKNTFDIATMIYCDFGVLAENLRKELLQKIYTALKDDGMFVFDVFSTNSFIDKMENTSWYYSDGGYWSEQPYTCLEAFYRYDAIKVYLEQYTVVTENSVECYNIWNHGFVKEELLQVLQEVGFKQIEFFANVAGEQYDQAGKTICVVASK